MEDKRKTLWQRLRVKYRVVVVNEETLGEKMHMHLSLMNLVLTFIALTLVTLGLFAVLIWTSPLKNYLPGFDASLRENLVEENARVDSLITMMDVHADYLSSFKSVIAGEVTVDSVGTLDSLYLLKREEMLAAKSQVVEAFVSDYEAQVGDQLTLFDKAINNEHSVPVFGRPANGLVLDAAAEDKVVCLQTGAREPVLAMLAGTIVSATYDMLGGWTITLQHGENWLTIYAGMEHLTHRVGDVVRVGDVLGTMDGERLLRVQVWEKGHAIALTEIMAL